MYQLVLSQIIDWISLMVIFGFIVTTPISHFNENHLVENRPKFFFKLNVTTTQGIKKYPKVISIFKM
jgi:hypothetical protein